MTATDVLRRLLDERGEVWGANDTYRLLVTSWDDARGHSWAFMEHRDGSFSKLTAYHLAPEQAIAATLGSCNCSNNCTNGERTETCEMEYVSDWMSWHCKSCDHMDMAPRNPKPRYCPWCGAKVVEPTTNDVDAKVGA